MACTSKRDTPPENLISPDDMSKILADIHIAEAKTMLAGYKSIDSSNVAFAQLQKEILGKYKVSKRDYDSSYAYYSKHLEEYNKIYERTIDTLNMRQTRMADL